MGEHDSPYRDLGGNLQDQEYSLGQQGGGDPDQLVVNRATTYATGARVAAGLPLPPAQGGPTDGERLMSQRKEPTADDLAKGAELAARLRAAQERMKMNDVEKGLGDTPSS